MADEAKTKPTDQDPREFLEGVEHEGRREDALKLLEIMAEITEASPEMWGASIVGFGRYTYRYASGRSGEWMRIGFSPRARNLTLYLMDGGIGYETDPEVPQLLAALGKHKTGKACLYLTRLSDVDETVLRTLIQRSWNATAIGENGEAETRG